MKYFISFLLAIVLFLSCREKDKYGKVVDTPTTGEITIVADESLRPIVEAEVETFNALHKNANVKVIYLPEAEAITAMLKEDSLKLAIVTRKLTTDERKYLMDKNKVRAREEDMAVSGIALIVNPANPDSLLSIADLKSMLMGRIKNWKDIGAHPKNNNGIKIVFDNPNSGLIRQLRDSVAKVDSLPNTCFAVNDNRAVVDYVSKNKNALGLIGLEWISDRDDTTTHGFLNKVKIVALAGDSAHFQPYQAYLALKYYPLRRTITVINREGRTGLGTGFAAFFGSERGQRIVLKSGLVPVTMPLRILNVHKEPFKVE
jgi:phosphate transport system substrate-binding protein